MNGALLSLPHRVDDRVMRGESGVDRLVAALALAICGLASLAGIAGAETAATSAHGPSGVVAPSLGTHFQETSFSSVAAQPGGGLVAKRGEQLESYLADGAPDPAAPPRKLGPYSRAIPLADGSTLIASESKLTRLNPDGSTDTSFGGGTVKAPIAVEQAMQLPSGKLLIASGGSGGTHTIISWVNVALLDSAGSVDTGVGKDGVLNVSVPTSSYVGGGVNAIAPTADGGALVAGSSYLLALRGDGSPLPGFGDGGLVGELPRLVGARMLPDGGVEAVGSGPGSGNEDLLVLRLAPGGARDQGFAPDGIRKFDLGAGETARSALWAPDGSVVVGGASQVSGECELGTCEQVPLLAGFDPSGALDPGFGQGGISTLRALAAAPGSYLEGGVNALARRPDGSLLAAGGAAPKQTVAFLAALSPQGAPLTGFGEGGIVRVRQPVPASQKIAGFASLPGGKLLAAGTADVGFEDAPVLIRYDADGSLDPSFGEGAGYVGLAPDRGAGGFAVSSSGRALVGVYDYPRSRLLLRSAADGSAVPSFGSDGTVQLPRRIFIRALGFAPDGDAIVVAARDVAGTTEPGAVLRYRENGKPDRGFGHGGRVDLSLPDGGEMKAQTLAIDRHGRILVGGRAHDRFAIARLLPDGRHDRRFGSGGWALARAGGLAKSATLRRAGSRIYLAGVANQQERLRLTLLRFDADGRPDRSFGHRGRLTAALHRAARPQAIVPSRNGVLVALNKGARPLLSFGRDGGVRRLPVGGRAAFVENVRALRVGDRLLLGWNSFSQAEHRQVYHLGSRPLR